MKKLLKEHHAHLSDNEIVRFAGHACLTASAVGDTKTFLFVAMDNALAEAREINSESMEEIKEVLDKYSEVNNKKKTNILN